ncbi:hypothetical protein D1AOALGA4SA_4352 [Olavius algarvensis Delta 1 endosymbiont]|nr:hypothetical protein D1AOALGA4SA_4352 [Olavius algarvensis Delta 1 endosymbiont]
MAILTIFQARLEMIGFGIVEICSLFQVSGFRCQHCRWPRASSLITEKKLMNVEPTGDGPFVIPCSFIQVNAESTYLNAGLFGPEGLRL